MGKNPLRRLGELGQSIWIDYLDRGRVVSGALERRIEEDGVRGVTSNPAIFQAAITREGVYEAPIRDLALAGRSVEEIYQAVTTRDIQLAADVLRPVFDRLDGRDGFVSLEVSPHLADDPVGTVGEARRLWRVVGRENVMIKVPATRSGLAAIRILVGEGINVNVTLLFGLDRYAEVAEAYLAGLEARASRGLPLRVASVASFFLSRIDVAVDKRLEELERAGRIPEETARGLRGEIAIASARTAYQMYKRIFGGERFAALAGGGARPQRLLWASTGTKNPAYSDVKYVEALIGAETVNTVPLETLDAYRDHGQPALRLEEQLDEAGAALRALATVGIDLGAVTEALEREGVRKFNEPYDQLLRTIAERRAEALRGGAEPTH